MGGGRSKSGEANVSLPKGKSQINHIFDDRAGHLTNTPRNRETLLGVANDPAYYIGKDENGVDWFAKTNSDGSQTWVRVLKGVIRDGGQNETPRPWDNITGLNNNPKK